MSSAAVSPAASFNNGVDYVIVYSFVSGEKSQSITQFEKLLQALANVGLATTVRDGDKHRLLVFVKVASDQYLNGEAYRSRVKDWLHGIRTAAPDKESSYSLEKEPLYEGERLRILYQLITNPTSEGGAGITPKKREWENVESIFALHDYEYNKKWLKQWSQKWTLKIDDLDEIRNRLGEKIAFYFAFTQSYFTALIGIASFGFASWFLLKPYSPVFAIVNTLLCVVFIEYWKHTEQDLAVRWGVRGVSSIEAKRHDFHAEKTITDPVTGEQMGIFPGPKRFQRQLLQIPFVLAASLGLGFVIATCFGIEIFVSEVYDGPMKSVLAFLPTVILATVQPLNLAFLTGLAEKLTRFENYETHAQWEQAMTQKIFVLNFVTSYLPILLTAFVYVPFASIIIPYLDVFQLTVKAFAENEKQMETPPPAKFDINPDRLKKQVIYFAVTAQIVNQAMEVLVPIIKRRAFSKYKEVQSSRAAKRGGAAPSAAENDAPEEAAFLKRVRQESELDVYEVTSDLREMVVQYGYLSLFSVVWPPTAVSFLINNWIELRTDAVKICVESQRPTPWRADSIGPWLDSLGFLTWFGSITTAALVYLFSNGGYGPDGKPSDIKAWALLLTIFFSEHSYLLVRWAAQLFVSKIETPGRQKERAERYMVRKRYLEESLGMQDGGSGEKGSGLQDVSRASLEDEARQSTLQSAKPEDRFWARQRSWQESAKVGASIIENTAPEESKKQQ